MQIKFLTNPNLRRDRTHHPVIGDTEILLVDLSGTLGVFFRKAVTVKVSSRERNASANAQNRLLLLA